MAFFEGFWSYVHADDEAEGGRISRLAKDVGDQFEMLTGEPLSLFLDRDALRWGEDWRNKVDASLASVAFFIPVLTPRYFLSAECRRELQFFARKATSLGIKDLILPLLYVGIPALHDDTTTDDLATLIRTFQWEDWRELRFAEPSTEAYRRGAARLAERIVEANKQAERTDVAGIALASERAVIDAEDQSPGFLDQISTAEETLPKMTETIKSIGSLIQVIATDTQDATGDLKRADKQGAGFAARLIVARKLSQRLAAPVTEIQSLTNQFSSQLHDVDEGFRVLIERAIDEARRDAASMQAACEFFRAVRSMNASTHSGLDSVQLFIDALAPIEKMSRDLRPPLRHLRGALTKMIEAGEVMDSWVHLIDASSIVCPEESSEGEDVHSA